MTFKFLILSSSAIFLTIFLAKRFGFIKSRTIPSKSHGPKAFVAARRITRDLADLSSYEFAGAEFNYEVVGESFQRDNLIGLIRSHKAFKTGEILAMADLISQPENEFDSTAVMVVVDGVQVGYIGKQDSPQVSAMIAASANGQMQVPARIGFDANSPSPLIGVYLALTLES